MVKIHENVRSILRHPNIAQSKMLHILKHAFLAYWFTPKYNNMVYIYEQTIFGFAHLVNFEGT